MMEYLLLLVFFLFGLAITLIAVMAELKLPKLMIWWVASCVGGLFGIFVGMMPAGDSNPSARSMFLRVGVSFFGGYLAIFFASWIERKRSRESASPSSWDGSHGDPKYEWSEGHHGPHPPQG